MADIGRLLASLQSPGTGALTKKRAPLAHRLTKTKMVSKPNKVLIQLRKMRLELKSGAYAASSSDLPVYSADIKAAVRAIESITKCKTLSELESTEKVIAATVNELLNRGCRTSRISAKKVSTVYGATRLALKVKDK